MMRISEAWTIASEAGKKLLADEIALSEFEAATRVSNWSTDRIKMPLADALVAAGRTAAAKDVARMIGSRESRGMMLASINLQTGSEDQRALHARLMELPTVA